jgi:site-specific DNA recombinase
MTPAKQPVRYAVYVRLSKDVKGSVSLGDQEARCRAFVASQAGVVAAVYGDTASGASTNGRGEFVRMVEDARAKPRKFDRIVALRVDRLGRSVLDLASLADVARKHGVAIQTVEGGIDSGTPTGQLVFDVLAAVAAMERELIRSRTRDSFERRRTLGLRWGGNPPYGLQWREGYAQPDEHLPAVKFIFERRAAGDSLSAIAEKLNARAEKNAAYRPRTAREWSVSSPEVIASILRNTDAYRPHIPDLPIVQ